MTTNTRDFSRRFAHYRRAAARGEPVRISGPDGIFVLTRESAGVTGADLLAKLGRMAPGRGLFSEGGADRIVGDGRKRTRAHSPWDK
jgi:hypothetical protein